MTLKNLLFDQPLISRKDATASDYFEAYLFNLGQEINPLVSTQTGDYTTKGRPIEIIICTNTSAITITLNSPFLDGQEVIIKRQGTGAVSYISADGVDGATSAIPILLQYDSVYVIATDKAGEWSRIQPRINDIYGSMYVVDPGFTVSISVATPVEVADSSSDGFSPGPLNGITFPSGGTEHYLQIATPGVYEVTWDISGSKSAGGSTQMHGGVMINGVAQRDNGEGHRMISASNDTGSMSGGGRYSLPNGNEQISLWVISDLSNDLNIEHANMLVRLVGSV